MGKKSSKTFCQENEFVYEQKLGDEKVFLS